jgi:hypothetical protein
MPLSCSCAMILRLLGDLGGAAVEVAPLLRYSLLI